MDEPYCLILRRENFLLAIYCLADNLRMHSKQERHQTDKESYTDCNKLRGTENPFIKLELLIFLFEHVCQIDYRDGNWKQQSETVESVDSEVVDFKTFNLSICDRLSFETFVVH